MGRHAVLVAGVIAAIAIASAAQRPAAPARPLTLEETEALVRDHAAGAVSGEADALRVTESSEKRFTEKELGCQAADPGDVPSVDGYAITVKHGQTKLEYRADQAGNLRRCRVVAPITQ